MKHWNTQTAPEVAIRYWKLRVSIQMRTLYHTTELLVYLCPVCWGGGGYEESGGFIPAGPD